MEVLFEYHRDHRQDGESLGELLRRIGMAEVIRLFREHPRTAHLMEKTSEILTDCVRDPESILPEKVS
jgi:hypothetical protein